MKEELQLFNSIVEDLLADEKMTGVLPPIPAAELFEQMDLSLSDEPTLKEDFEASLRDLVLKTPRTATKQFFNQLFGGRQNKAVLGDLLAVLLNNSMYTYKVAGPMVGVEKEILSKISDLVGYPKDAAGTIATGGSMTNYMGMLMARDYFDPSIKYEGTTKRLIAYTSEASHYSIPKNAAFIGIGRSNVRKIGTNEVGEMRTDLLEAQIKQDLADGFHPFFVNATAGTTVLGAFDPFEEIAAICEKYNLWMHVDGAYCGSVIFSEKYKHLAKGVDKAHSFSVNAHKMLGTPLTCSIIVTKRKKCLYDSFSNDATYLYQTDGDDYNLGKTSLQCGRRNDALKLWTLWKSVGTKGLEKIVDNQFYLADVAREYIRQHPDYQLYSFDNSISVCFNYKDIPADVLCTELYEEAELMVGYGSNEGTQFVRFVTINATNEKEDILNFFKKMEAFVAKREVVSV